MNERNENRRKLAVVDETNGRTTEVRMVGWRPDGDKPGTITVPNEELTLSGVSLEVGRGFWVNANLEAVNEQDLGFHDPRPLYSEDYDRSINGLYARTNSEGRVLTEAELNE